MITSNKLYDALKYLAQIILPALGTLYLALSQIWGLSHGSEVIGSIVAADTFLGVILHLSSNAYDASEAKYDGSIDIHEDAESKVFSLNLDGDPDDIDKKKQLTFKVNPEIKPKKRVSRAKKSIK